VVSAAKAAFAEIGIMTENIHNPVAVEPSSVEVTPPAQAGAHDAPPPVPEETAPPAVTQEQPERPEPPPAVAAEQPEVYSDPDVPPPADEPPAPEPVAEIPAASEPEAPAEDPNKAKKHWYVVKVQSGREDTIREAIEKKVRKEGLEDCFGKILIPVEKVTEVKVDKNGKKVTRTKERRLYAGYLFVEVEYNDRILYLFRETSGVGGFVGEHPGHPERPPTPMSEREVLKLLGGAIGGDKEAAKSDVPPPPKISVGEHVRVIDGPFNGMDAVVKAIHAETAKILAEVTIFGRPVEVDFEYYQIEH
jgi:transcriptional antiterminator NusG